ncbi:WD40-repeat-containing domain protein [Lactarius quietus]|nr:WD40-repeat-containing domain protein [Lactarius quietus]
MISSSNAIPIASRYTSGSSSPTIQPFGPSSIAPQPPFKPPQGTVLDGNYPPRQPRADAAMQVMAPVSLGQGVVPRSQPQYHRQQRHNHSPHSPADGHGRGIPMASGTKRKASPPRAELPASFEIPAKRASPSTWPNVSPIHCANVQGEHVAIQGITFNGTGKLMAVACADCTIRIWDNVMYSEVARLPHSSGVVSTQWMDGDAGLLALCADGALLRWARPAGDTPPRTHDVWNWSVIAEPAIGTALDDAPTALAYIHDRIAVSFPKFGVRIWVMKQGSWQSHRPINRQNVTALEFIDNGGVLLGGTKDGVFWHCAMLDGTPRVYNFFKARIRGIDVLPTGTHALVSQQVGRAHLVAISQGEDYGKITQVYTVAPELLSDAVYEANAMFVGRDNAVLYGSACGYLFACDRTSAKVLCGLDHGEGCVVQAIGAYRRNAIMGEGCVVTGSRDGRLNWWAEPGGFTSNEELPNGKRIKSS